jgi:hypothetical protein
MKTSLDYAQILGLQITISKLEAKKILTSIEQESLNWMINEIKLLNKD